MNAQRWLTGMVMAGVLGLTVGCGQGPIVLKPAEVPPPLRPEALKRLGEFSPPPLVKPARL
jgi:hypothetical protein